MGEGNIEIRRDINIPLYKQIYDNIKKSILDGSYKSGELMPSERELSNMFSVDRITVRRSLEMLVNDGLVEKIAGLGTRVKDFPKHENGAISSSNILFVLPRTSNNVDRITEPFNSSLFYRVEKECKKKGYNLMYTTLSGDDDILDIINRNNTAGVIYVSKVDDAIYEKTLEHKIHAILVNNTHQMFTSIMIDNEKGAYDAVRYLTELGHKRIAFIKGKEGYNTSAERFNGYVRALTEAGLDWHEQSIGEGDWTFDGGYKAMMSILQQAGKRPSAVFASNDTTAFGAIEAIREAELSVPDDISVVGFDDIEQCRFIRPQLTTVNVDTNALGKAACQYLFGYIESELDLNLKIVVPASLVKRESVKAYK